MKFNTLGQTLAHTAGRAGLIVMVCAGLASTSLAAEPSAAKKALIQKVLQLQQPGIEAFAQQAIVEQPAARMLQAAGSALQSKPSDQRESIGKALEGDARKYVDDVGPSVRKRAVALAPVTLTPLLDAQFNEAELKTLIAWLESPVSRKYGQMQPDLQKALGEKLANESRPTLEPKLKALEQSMAGRLGLTAPGGAASAPAK